VHELRVAHPVGFGRGVDAGDPQAAEVALAVAPVAVGVRVRLHQRLLGALVVRVRLAAVALRQLERRAALLARAKRALDAGHLPPPSLRFPRGTSSPEITAGLRSARLRLGDFFSRMWLVKACRPRTLPVEVTRKRFLAPECVFILGMSEPTIMARPCWPRVRSRRRTRARWRSAAARRPPRHSAPRA